jgi:hypothetical protein
LFAKTLRAASAEPHDAFAVGANSVANAAMAIAIRPLFVTGSKRLFITFLLCVVSRKHFWRVEIMVVILL